MRLKSRKRLVVLTALVTALCLAPIIGLQTASATKLVDTDSTKCAAVALSKFQRIQYCTGLSHSSDYPVWGNADISVQSKDFDGNWVTEYLNSDILVNVASVTLFNDNSDVGSNSPYDQELVAGYDMEGIRSPYYPAQDEPVTLRTNATFEYQVKGVTKSLSLTGRNVTRTYRSDSATGDSDNGTPPLPEPGDDYYASLACKTQRAVSNVPLRLCTWSQGTHATATITALKQTTDGWETDTDTFVSIDEVRNYVNGIEVGGASYPSGPQAGTVTESTRGIADVALGDTVAAKATFTHWTDGGKKLKTYTLKSANGTVG